LRRWRRNGFSFDSGGQGFAICCGVLLANKFLASPYFPERMAKTAQVLSSLNENFFDFFDFAVKKFCGSSS
jgi:hypothetical protein